MSRQIEDVLQILGEIRSVHQGADGDRSLQRLRRIATERLASRTSRDAASIHDALTRRLAVSAAGFDKAVEHWLRGDNSRLREILEGNAHGADDDAAINAFLHDQLVLPFAPLSSPSTEPTVKTRPKSSPPKRRAIMLDPDVAKVFPTDRAVNTALRNLIRVARKTIRK